MRVMKPVFSPRPYLPSGEPLRVPGAFAKLAEDVICHSNRERLSLLYEAAWRIVQGERYLVNVAADPLAHRLLLMQKDVRRDIHKMHAFVRFRRVEDEDGERFIAWFEPKHRILERVAPFFTGRFPSMRWSILTLSDRCIGMAPRLSYGDAVRGRRRQRAMRWRIGGEVIIARAFNPARANPQMMRAEMPKRYWRNLPEARLIPELLAEARRARTACWLRLLLFRISAFRRLSVIIRMGHRLPPLADLAREAVRARAALFIGMRRRPCSARALKTLGL